MTEPLPAVAAYDPYIGRALAGIRTAIADGHAVLVRFHPAGVFTGADDPCGEQLDREGHAVLLTGYDDAAGAFRYFEPVSGQTRPIRYDEFGLMVVDSTFDFTLILADLQVSCSLEADALEVSVSLYRPHMPVIDDVATILDDVSVQFASGRLFSLANGVGGVHRASIPLALLSPDDIGAGATVTARLKGVRPLPYARLLTRELRLPALSARSV